MSLLLLAGTASATLPLPTWPECGEIDRPDLCPPDLGEDWEFISYIPAGSRDSVRSEELELGSGCAADLAWRQSTGRFDVTVGILDSGFDWSNTNYVNKILLNQAELPPPIGEDGEEVPSYDADGNGLVNVQDWQWDPRVTMDLGDDVADGLLDPSDLIAAFEDGVDDDGNGFVDDIAGWDFFGDDNDPYNTYADGFGTHGDGVAEEIAAEGGDSGDIGVCPNCSILPVRVGDTFITDGSRAGMGMEYAVSRGVAVINMSVGALTGPAFARQAAQDAYEAGVVLVGAAGDENAYHANQPALYDHIFFVKSLHSDTDDESQGVYSYFNTWNCNNYGVRLSWSVASSACATGAAAVTSGSAGLLLSYAKDLGLSLTPDEVFQLLAMNVDDIDLTADEQDEANTYPSAEGWDFFFGYGRLNLGRAVQALHDGAIPPAMDISAPGWLDVYTPSGTIDIEGYIAADRSASFDWVVEYGTGPDPKTWTELASGTSTSRLDGTLATLDLSTLSEAAVPTPDVDETIVERVDRVFAPAVTVRLRATDAEGHAGTFRKTFFVRPDPDLADGFPVDMGEGGESSPIFADLDGDGLDEIVVATGGGAIHAYEAGGGELSGFPLHTPTNPRYHGTDDALQDGFVATVSVGDLDGDGSPEIVAPSGTGRVYAWHADGTMVDGFPVEMVGRTPDEFDSTHVYDNGFAGAVALADLDGDGTLELAAAGMDERLYVWDHTGADWGPYPVDVCEADLCDTSGTRIINTPAVGDADGDGDLDLAFGSNETADDGSASVSYVYDALSGTVLDGWPVLQKGLVGEAGLLPIVGEGHPGSMAFADLDGDGKDELGNPIMLGQTPILRGDGTSYLDLSYIASGWPGEGNTNEPSLVNMANQPAFGDMTGDGVPDYVVGGAGANYLITLPMFQARDWQNVVAAWDGVSGEQLPGWPQQIEDLQFLMSPAVADITGDGKAETIIGSGGYLVHAWDEDGNAPEGWPKFTGGWILGSPAVGDLDGDGYLDVAVTTREGNLFVWTTGGHADQSTGWWGIHHDPQNTGNFGTPLPEHAGPAKEAAEPEGCGCVATPVTPAWIGLLGVAGLVRRRRR